ncbi:sel1 repeat family protein [Albimonas pacifica]|uniref:Uncharacterized protein n=1 Tax=Albimonas pacifica TaxID=1114924 RepID=A0A1I3NMV4_9RHOB|nr:sel1 repeat family protein [Albimonas pacifica]SFJ10634.1 hypothetical protein SAMN05216258_1143 [Albimonas pacifica]
MQRPSPRIAAVAAVACLGAGVAVAPRPAAGQGLLDALGLGRISEPTLRLAIEVALSSLRSTMDVTYDGFAIGPGGEEVMISGLHLSPPVEQGWCEIHIGRVEVFPGAVFGPGETVLGLHEGTASLDCLPPWLAAEAERAGYERLEIDGLDLRLTYDPSSSALTVDLAAAAAEALDLQVELDLGYFWPVNPGFSRSSPLPSARFDRLAIRVDEQGLISRAVRLAGYESDPDALAEVFREGLHAILAPGETAELSEEAEEIAGRLAAAAARVAAEGGAMEVEIVPRDELWLETGLFDDPAGLLASVQVRLPAGDDPPPEDAASPAEVRRATEDPGSLPPERLRALAEALAEGRGAPEAPTLARRLLRPLVDAGDLDATVMLAGMISKTEPSEAYRMLLAVAASGRADAAARMDEIEIELGLAEVIAAQDDAGADVGDADPLLEPGAPRVIVAAQAARLEAGREVARNYERAYLGYTLAAALGDRGSAMRRDLLDRRMMARGADFWNVRRELLRGRAFDAWLARAE